MPDPHTLSGGPEPAEGSRFWGLPKSGVGWGAFACWILASVFTVLPVIARLADSQGLFNATFGLGGGFVGIPLATLALALFLVAVLTKRERSILVWLALTLPITLLLFVAGELFGWME